jgi:phosphate acyltransferase
MGEHPTKAFSKKTGSSIAAGFSLLKDKKIDAFASAGNTGAMLVGSIYTVKSVTGVIRPCITSMLPKESGNYNIILDVGANADCKPDVLYQFGILGSLFSKYIFNNENPRVGLLNIGEEEKKGNLLTQAAHELMKDSKDFNFIGNVEGRDIFSEKVDVIVCDGFTGNVVLKEAESFYSLIKKRGIKDEFFDKFNYELYGGTPILGINSNVIIGHGISNGLAIKNMVLLSKDVTEARLSDKIKEAFV